jgi:Fe2+ transport system protein FeoA
MISRLRLRARLRAHKRRRAQAKHLHLVHEMHCMSLCCGKRGDSLQITQLVGCEHEASRLRDLGVHEGALVTILRDGDPLMIKVDNARFGLSRAAATNVHCAMRSPAH